MKKILVLKRNIFDRFSITFLKLNGLKRDVIPLFITSLIIISLSFYASIKGASEFSSKSDSIELESKEGVGTRFFFTIAFESDKNKKNEIINNIIVDLTPNNFYKILVVEDNKINQIVTKKILEINNFKCTITEDGYAAINLLESQHFDLILMDINMPIINGFETSKLIRKKGFTIPIIALTAFDKQEITEQVLSSGMNDIIIKPFEQAKLFQVINKLVTKKTLINTNVFYSF